jgi:hypothetical protein
MSTTDKRPGSKLGVIAAATGERPKLGTREIVALGVSREYVRKLASRDQLERVGRGV